MNTFIKSLFVVLILVTSTLAADVTFTWTKNPESELVSSYVLEYTKVPGITNWTVLTTVTGKTNSTTVKGVQAGFKYQFRLFAVNAVGKSTNLSNIILIPTNSPTSVKNFNGEIQ